MSTDDALKILLIDDSEFCLKLGESLLTLEGFVVRCAQNVLEFVEILSKWHPDIILTDVEMPDVQGEELCRSLKEKMDTKRIPIVLFSNLPRTELEELARKSHADGFLSKSDGYHRLGPQIRELTESILW